jgi:23S rRNA pseudouridine2457 synthase
MGRHGGRPSKITKAVRRKAGGLFAGMTVGLVCRISVPFVLSVVHLRGVLIAFNKPYGVLSQFTPEPGSPYRTLADFGFPERVYAIGRLDGDSEGLLLLSDEPGLNTRLLDPKHGHRRVYWAQVERVPSADALRELERGVLVQGKKTLPCRARLLDDEPEMPLREPSVRFRKNVPTAWIELELTEGRNRQVRRMTAAIGHPTLRLLRVRIGEFALGTLAPGEWRELTADERRLVGV